MVRGSVTSERSGCLLFALPRALLSTTRVALPDHARLPALDAARVHRDDLPALVRARRAGQACLDDVRTVGGGAPPHVVAEVSGRVVDVVGALEAVAHRLAEARQFIERHGSDALARERTELELSMIGASAAAIREHRRSLDALNERARLAGDLQHHIGTLVLRLDAGGHELEALHARVGSQLGDETLLHELRAYQTSARAALDAFQDAWREVEAH